MFFILFLILILSSIFPISESNFSFCLVNLSILAAASPIFFSLAFTSSCTFVVLPAFAIFLPSSSIFLPCSLSGILSSGILKIISFCVCLYSSGTSMHFIALHSSSRCFKIFSCLLSLMSFILSFPICIMSFPAIPIWITL